MGLKKTMVSFWGLGATLVPSELSVKTTRRLFCLGIATHGEACLFALAIDFSMSGI